MEHVCIIFGRSKVMRIMVKMCIRDSIGEKSVRGKGIGTEVVQILLRYCFMVLGVYSVCLLYTSAHPCRCGQDGRPCRA